MDNIIWIIRKMDNIIEYSPDGQHHVDYSPDGMQTEFKHLQLPFFLKPHGLTFNFRIYTIYNLYNLYKLVELYTGRMDPRVGSGRVGS